MTHALDATDWWRRAVVYQVYPRSFADSDGDGIGDLPGIRSRLSYLADLGVDAVWLSPFYPSPLADGGYDISDHRAVDPRLGTLQDFEDLTATAHELGLRVIVDIVPNHTSDQHPWFRAALAAGAGSPERERYIFRDGLGPERSAPPADWRSHFGGGAWEPVGDGQWYCHLFAREQPDLNWDHPEVRDYFLETLRFWADRGADGFRIDVAHALTKDLSTPLRSQPHLDRRLPADGTDPLYDRDEVHEIYRSWRKVLDEYAPPRMAVAETWTPTSPRTYLYARPDELGQVFDFSLLKAPWSAGGFREVIARSLDEHAALGTGGTTWVLSNHDVPRHASRHALPQDVDLDAWLMSDGAEPPIDPALADRRARAAALLLLALPGSAYLYQGEELGLLEVADLPSEVLQDPTWERSGHRIKGRDGARVPVPWTVGGSSFGFGTAGAWLPQPAWFGRYAVERQLADPASMLSLYRTAIALRRTLDGPDPALEWHGEDPDVLDFTRCGGWRCVVNLSRRPVPLPDGVVLLASSPDTACAHKRVLPSDSAVWMRSRVSRGG